MSSIDPSQCPLCGHPNQCGMAAGKGTCWCYTRSIPAEVLERIPGSARDLACICETCATGQRSCGDTHRQMKKILRDH